VTVPLFWSLDAPKSAEHRERKKATKKSGEGHQEIRPSSSNLTN
jgi:hypothetical protein